MSSSACIFAGSGFTPCHVTTSPRYRSSGRRKYHLSLLRRSCPICTSFFTAFSNRLSCCSIVDHHTMISSMYTHTPSTFSRHWYTVLWKTSGAEQIPIGSRRYRYLPNGVLKVAIMDDFSYNSIWWKPAVASILEKYFAPASSPSISSFVGIWKCSYLIALLRYFGYMHIRTSQFLFSIMTIKLTRHVGSLTLAR